MKNMTKRERGFTLIELLVVIAILGVLGGLAVPRVIGAVEDARRNGNIANRAIIQSAVERYYIENGDWPITSGGGALPTGTSIILITATELVDFVQGGRLPAINEVDMDPGTGTTSVVATNRWGLNAAGQVVIATDASPPVLVWQAP